ncbi:coiled-coil domain-containing protein 150-like isoform X3 [Ostrea edulis]|uniref:coiled-coil domain-containing protein 150-like isoform X3 n=1 Tax=Ostrea edulis TaxID=37623 RepID=UPI0024AFC528|nr:coiled-coil domain-containing protein 150-like isoform X3 [Ostrea edulis]
MSRAVIPPMSLSMEGPSSQQSLDVLEKRLEAAEYDTQDLIEKLGTMGFGKNTRPAEKDVIDHREVISPYQAKIVDVDILKDNYETLVSRVCKTESVIQTLKLNMINLQGDRDLKVKNSDDYEQKYDMLKETYEQELGKLRRKLDQVTEDLKTEHEARLKSKEEVKFLKTELENAAATKESISAASDELSSQKSKFQKRINEIREELEREKSLRHSLEESHNTLLARIREMESIVESERKEVKTLSNDCTNLRNDAVKVREELRQEKSEREMYESQFKQTNQEHEHLKKNYESAEADRKLLLSEMQRLRSQYEDLIKQLEQTQVIVDQQKSNNTKLEQENEHLNKIVNSASEEKERMKSMHERELELMCAFDIVQAEKKRVNEKQKFEEEALQSKLRVQDLSSQNETLKKKLAHAEKELQSLNKKYVVKDEEYNKASEGLEKELSSLKHKYTIVNKEKLKLSKDKENLLEEVSQTVDSMQVEHSKLTTEIHQLKSELESQTKRRNALEQENATLLERVSQFDQQRDSQSHVEKVMKDMMEQKNKLAYDNGRLQMEVQELRGQVDILKSSSTDAEQLRAKSTSLQSRYDVAQKEISDLKINVQRLENQLRTSQGSMETREKDYTFAVLTRDELLREKTLLMEKLKDMEEREKRKVTTLQKNLDDAKTVNKEIASTLEAVMSSHSQLQSVVEGLQVDLGKKDSQMALLKSEKQTRVSLQSIQATDRKNKEQGEWKQEMRKFEERMETLRGDLKKEREKSQKKNIKDISEIKKQNDNLQTRNMELVKANTDLRHKQGDSENMIQNLKDKVSEQKKRIEYLNRSKKEMEENSERMKVMREEMEELEKLRDEYIHRNAEQGEMITSFMTQIGSLQEELRQLAQAQLRTNDLVKQRDEALEKERMLKDELRKKHKKSSETDNGQHKHKYKDSRRHQDEVEKMRRETEERLRRAQDESMEVSGHLQDAHEWFKTRFDQLQQEILESRKTQNVLESENHEHKKQLEVERWKSHAAAEKARDMIKTSRQTISQLANYADIADTDTKHQLLKLQAELEQEKDHAKYLESKHQKYKEASARQLEQLLKEFHH